MLLCHISMAGINERIFQFKTLLDKGVYYFGPRTVAKCTKLLNKSNTHKMVVVADIFDILLNIS